MSLSLHAVLGRLMYTTVSQTPPSHKTNGTDLIIDSPESAIELLDKYPVKANRGWHHALLAAKAPTVATVKLAKSMFGYEKDKMGVYCVLLEKPGCQPRLYMGSALRKEGIRLRLGHYRARERNAQLMPRFVTKSLKEGYTITHTAAILVFDRPRADLRPLAKVMGKILESTMMAAFWSIKPGYDETVAALAATYAWNIEEQSYQGLNSRLALLEIDLESLGLSPELLLQAEAAAKAQRAVTVKMVTKRFLEANPKYHREYDAKQREKDDFIKDEYYCHVCVAGFPNNNEWQRRLAGPHHALKVERDAKGGLCRCELCGKGFCRNDSVIRHKRNVHGLDI